MSVPGSQQDSFCYVRLRHRFCHMVIHSQRGRSTGKSLFTPSSSSFAANDSIPLLQAIIAWLGVTVSKFYNWRQRYGRVNEHNGWVPRDFWLDPSEKEAIIGFHLKNPLEGYRRLTFMMLDAE